MLFSSKVKCNWVYAASTGQKNVYVNTYHSLSTTYPVTSGRVVGHIAPGWVSVCAITSSLQGRDRDTQTTIRKEPTVALGQHADTT